MELLGVPPLSDAVVTADAMFTHADFAAKVRAGGGDDLLPLKDNQPRRLADVVLAFETAAALSPPATAAPGIRPADGPLLG